MRWLRLGGLLVLTILTAACPAIPQPFRSEVDDNPLTLLRSGVGVVVRPATGVDEPMRTALAQTMAKALARAEIPANVAEGGEEPLRYVLQPAVHELLREETVARVAVMWTLRHGGEATAEEMVRITVDDDRWKVADPDYLQTVVAAPARSFAAQLNENPGAAPAIPAPPTVALAGITGLPDEGNAVLSRTMEGALRRMGMDMRDRGAFEISCVITLEPARVLTTTGKPAEAKSMRVAWTVRKSDGTSLGTVTQQNDVPLTLLRPPWRELAMAVAGGGADGVGAIVMRQYRADRKIGR